MRFLYFLPCLLLFSCFFSVSLRAQDTDLYMGSAMRPIQIMAGAVYQEYSDEEFELAQVAFPVRAFIPVNRNLGFAFRTAPVLVFANNPTNVGDSLANVNGLSDAQIAVSYHQRIGEGSVVVSLAANLPSGKRELTPEEFETMGYISQDYFGFGVSVLGQGLNLTPGLTVAYPVNQNVVVGAGASYQLRGEFKPVALSPESIEPGSDSFVPGDEILITGGVDVRIARSWAASTNVSYIIYQQDELGNGTQIFDSGDQLFASIQVLGNIGSNQLKMVTQYRGKAKSEVPTSDSTQVVTAPRTVPNQFQFATTYRIRIQDNLSATLLGRVAYYDETDFFSRKTRFDLGAYQNYTFDELIGAYVRFVYTFGSFPGVEIGGGLVFTL